MAAKYTNTTGIPITTALWLAHDEYDHNADPFTISASTLIKPVRQIVLAMRTPPEKLPVPDISKLVASRIGTAIHNAIEQTWLNHHAKLMADLGYANGLINKVVINPADDEKLPLGAVPVWLEQRTEKKVGRWTVSGKYDIVIDWMIRDFKSTKVYTYIKGTKDFEYMMQGSIYRWLNPEKIKKDVMAIDFIFTDWSAASAARTENYPPHAVMEHKYPLLSVAEADEWIKQKLDKIDHALTLPEDQIEHCSETDLWKEPDTHKYFANPAKTDGRSTKNFTDLGEANGHLAKQGKGVIITVPGQVKACHFCDVFETCTQKDSLIASGELVVA